MGETGQPSSIGLLPSGGGGGESAFGSLRAVGRRAAGGAGGRLAPDAAFEGRPSMLENWGLLAQEGFPGSSISLGALSQPSPPQGGGLGVTWFGDGNPDNDFWGTRTVMGQTVVGELPYPVAGSGGGGGGDLILSSMFPQLPWDATAWSQVLTGAGGGGGGGLGMFFASTFIVAGDGMLLANGGAGGRGEARLVATPGGMVSSQGGAGGGGSGGMLVIQADLLDLTNAGPDTFRARGGAGGNSTAAGPGGPWLKPGPGSGGNGGPGLVQFHVSDLSRILLAPGVRIERLSTPEAKVLDRLF